MLLTGKRKNYIVAAAIAVLSSGITFIRPACNQAQAQDDSQADFYQARRHDQGKKQRKTEVQQGDHGQRQPRGQGCRHSSQQPAQNQYCEFGPGNFPGARPAGQGREDETENDGAGKAKDHFMLMVQ